MTTSTFSIELAQQLIDDSAPFPVEMSTAWNWVGYTRKSDAIKHFKNCGFIENEDYTIRKTNIAVTLTGQCAADSAHPKQVVSTPTGFKAVNKYWLSVDTFKCWAMMVGTTVGREVRQYFLKCESTLKNLLPQLEAANNTIATLTEQLEQHQNATPNHQSEIQSDLDFYRAKMRDNVDNTRALAVTTNAYKAILMQHREVLSEHAPVTTSGTGTQTSQRATGMRYNIFEHLEDKVLENFLRITKRAISNTKILRRSDVLRNIEFQLRRKRSNKSELDAVAFKFDTLIARCIDTGFIEVAKPGTWNLLAGYPEIANLLNS